MLFQLIKLESVQNVFLHTVLILFGNIELYKILNKKETEPVVTIQFSSFNNRIE